VRNKEAKRHKLWPKLL